MDITQHTANAKESIAAAYRHLDDRLDLAQAIGLTMLGLAGVMALVGTSTGCM